MLILINPNKLVVWIFKGDALTLKRIIYTVASIRGGYKITFNYPLIESVSDIVCNLRRWGCFSNFIHFSSFIQLVKCSDTCLWNKKNKKNQKHFWPFSSRSGLNLLHFSPWRLCGSTGGGKKKKNTSKKWCCNSRVWVVLPHVRGLVTVLFLSVQQP